MSLSLVVDSSTRRLDAALLVRSEDRWDDHQSSVRRSISSEAAYEGVDPREYWPVAAALGATSACAVRPITVHETSEARVKLWAASSAQACDDGFFVIDRDLQAACHDEPFWGRCLTSLHSTDGSARTLDLETMPFEVAWVKRADWPWVHVRVPPRACAVCGETVFLKCESDYCARRPRAL